MERLHQAVSVSLFLFVVSVEQWRDSIKLCLSVCFFLLSLLSSGETPSSCVCQSVSFCCLCRAVERLNQAVSVSLFLFVVSVEQWRDSIKLCLSVCFLLLSCRAVERLHQAVSVSLFLVVVSVEQWRDSIKLCLSVCFFLLSL